MEVQYHRFPQYHQKAQCQYHQYSDEGTSTGMESQYQYQQYSDEVLSTGMEAQYQYQQYSDAAPGNSHGVIPKTVCHQIGVTQRLRKAK